VFIRGSFPAHDCPGKYRMNLSFLHPSLNNGHMGNGIPKRRWHQFSIRALLVSMFLLAVIVGWTGRKVRQAQINRDSKSPVEAAISVIEKSGGKVTESKRESRRLSSWLEDLLHDPGPADDRVHAITGVGVEVVNDDGLTQLDSLPDLEILWLRGSNFTAEGLDHLEGRRGFMVGTRARGYEKFRHMLPKKCLIFSF